MGVFSLSEQWLNSVSQLVTCSISSGCPEYAQATPENLAINQHQDGSDGTENTYVVPKSIPMTMISSVLWLEAMMAWL